MDVLRIADSYLAVLHTNVYVSGVVTLFLVLYGAMAAPALPVGLASLFENSLFKLLILVLVLVVRNYNPTMAVLVAIGFVISMQTLSKYRIFTMANELSGVVTAPVKALGDLVSSLSDTVSTDSEKFSEVAQPQAVSNDEETGSSGLGGYQGPDLATIGLPDSQL